MLNGRIARLRKLFNAQTLDEINIYTILAIALNTHVRVAEDVSIPKWTPEEIRRLKAGLPVNRSERAKTMKLWRLR